MCFMLFPTTLEPAITTIGFGTGPLPTAGIFVYDHMGHKPGQINYDVHGVPTSGSVSMRWIGPTVGYTLPASMAGHGVPACGYWASAVAA
jgi:hypothetical protein